MKTFNRRLVSKFVIYYCVFFPSIGIAAPPHNSTIVRKYSNYHGTIQGIEYYQQNTGRSTYVTRAGRPYAYSFQSSPNSRVYSNSSGSYRFRETFRSGGAASTFYGRNGAPIGFSTNKKK